MRKGFTRKPKADEPATQGKNYITPSELQRLQDEPKVGDSVRNIAPLTRIIADAIFGGLVRVPGNPVAKSRGVGKTDGWMKFKRASDSQLYRKARRGFGVIRLRPSHSTARMT
jgi:hypothetical protein